ncbi:MAG: hypothetical protein COB51_00465 [Moraxellaceae bacterium]|nr:MAG: hypothetical protein COB51_00465 [Moraxellaceae bacterium]
MGIFSRDKTESDEVSERALEVDEDVEEEASDQEVVEGLSLGNIDFGHDLNTAVNQKARPPTFSYGIEHAIQLMRELPKGELEVVVTVVKKTLESMSVTVTDIIQDAEFKEQEIRQKSDQLSQEIVDLELQISDRKTQICELNEQAKETSLVKNHLKLAEQLDKKNAPQITQQDDDDVAETQEASGISSEEVQQEGVKSDPVDLAHGEADSAEAPESKNQTDSAPTTVFSSALSDSKGPSSNSTKH